MFLDLGSAGATPLLPRMNSNGSQTRRLIAVFFVGGAAFLAATGQWASAATALGMLLILFAILTWRDRRGSEPPGGPQEEEARIRRAISRALPILLVIFLAGAVYNLVAGDWFGAGYAGLSFVAALVALYFNRRRSAEIEQREVVDGR